jgi:mono/diheme cytochrome c family protein
MAIRTRRPSRTITTSAGLAIAGALALPACRESEQAQDDEVFPTETIEDPREVVRAATPPPAVTGAALTVIDEDRVVVTDPDRDLVHIVGVAEETRVDLPAGAQPWRTVADRSGRVHVVLRGLGSVATIDVGTAELLATRTVCPTVRGVGLRTAAATRAGTDPDDTLVFACAGGEVVSMPVDPTQDDRTVLARLDPDLRDVLVGPDGSLSITRFRSAEVLGLADDGSVASRTAPPPWLHADPIDFDTSELVTMRTSTAWRTLARPDGGWVMVHQGGSDAAIDPAEDDDDDGEAPTDTGPVGGGSEYGSAGGSNTCGSVVQSAVTLLRGDGVLVSSGALSGAVLPVDFAVHPGGKHVALAIAGTCASGCSLPQVIELPLEALSVGVGLQERPCTGGTPILFAESGAQIVAVAYTPSGRLWALQREPSIIHLLGQDSVQSVPLTDFSVEDTGHRLFHEAGSAGVTCASCHPEGGDDGLVWNLPTPLHTPALDVGLAGTAPFHWNGELEDFGALVHEVHERRMGEMAQPGVRVYAFESWVTQLRATPPRAPDDAAAAGRKLFGELGCNSCHAGDATTNNETVAVGDLAAVQVPSLHGVALHPPYMHDGRSPTLADAVEEMITKSRPDAAFDDGDVASLVAYLETI